MHQVYLPQDTRKKLNRSSPNSNTEFLLRFYPFIALCKNYRHCETYILIASAKKFPVFSGGDLEKIYSLGTVKSFAI